MRKIDPAVLIALLYFLLGALWIYLTDIISFWQSNSLELLNQRQTYKGLLFIFMTSVALFLLIRQTNKRLREKGREYEVLFEENPNPMWVYDAESLQFLAVNQAALEQYGYSREAFLHLTAPEIRPPEDRPLFLQAIHAPFDSFVYFGHWRLLKKSGEVVHTEIYLHKVLFQGKKAYLNLIMDITERLRVEAERRKLIDELTRQNLDLQQFAYITSHNLRAPIANIMGLVELYSLENKPEENLQIVTKLGESARSLDVVVRDLNDLLVIRTRQQQELQVVSFERVFRFIQQSLHQEIQASAAQIHTNFSRAPEVVSVRNYVQTICYNLLANALKYRSPERPLQIKVTSAREGNFVCLQVQDNGLGIDLERNQEKLFGMYKRFHRHVEGKGLGLHLIKTQIEALGGSITVESTPGQGATFKACFPVPEK